jgi:acyl-CoA synthetase
VSLLSLQDVAMARRFYEQGYWQDETMYGALRRWAQATPDAWFLRDSESRLTYRQALGWVDALAADMTASGIRAGQRVSIWLPSRAESVLILLACSRMGAVCNSSLHRDYTVADVVGLLKRADSAALFMQPGYGADADRYDVRDRVGDLPSLKRIYALAPIGTVDHGADLPARFGLAPGMGADAPCATSPDRVVYLAFTSGTTGQPKGVMHSDNTLLSNGRVIAKDWKFTTDSVLYTLSPMSHNMGTVTMVTVLACGAELVVHTHATGAQSLDRVLETGATYLVGVPAHAILLLAAARARGLAGFGQVKTFQLAGSPIPGELVEQLMRRGVSVQNTFGMTENCSFQYTHPDDPPEVIVNTCGRTCDGFELTLWDQEDRDRQVAVGEIGELGGRGASLMLGYFDDQSSTEKSFNAHGWFMTGDLGRLDAAGNVSIVGRMKDLIIRGGHNIHPARIEDYAMRHPAVQKAAVFPVADAVLGEKACLAVVLHAGESAEPEALLEHLDRLGLSKYEMPEYFLRLESFPLTASGKVLKRGLVEMVKTGAVTPAPIIRAKKPAQGSM